MGRDNRGGRGQNGGRGYRGGRGTGRYQGTRTFNTSSKLEMKLLYPHGIGIERQTVTYDTVKDHLVQTVQKNFIHGQDIAISLRDLQVKDLSKLKPVRLDSTASDDASRK